MNVVVMAIFDAGTVVEVVRLNVITVMVQEVFAVIGAMELGKMGVVFIVLVWDMMMMALCVFSAMVQEKTTAFHAMAEDIRTVMNVKGQVK